MASTFQDLPELRNLQFPLSEAKLAEVAAALKARSDLPTPARPEPPRFSTSATTLTRHKSIQQFIESFEYNFTGENFFNVKGVRQNQSLFRVLEVARRVIKESLPIKCVEAVYLGIYLTQSMADIDRLPLIFNSEIDGHKYGHIVLALRYDGKLGAIGLSRRSDLMYKSWGYETLADLVYDYKSSYEKWKHKLLKIKIGTLVPHEGSNRISEAIDWAQTVISLKTMSWEEAKPLLHKRARSLGWEAKEISAPVLKRGNSTAKASQPSPVKAPATAPAEEDGGEEAEGSPAASGADGKARPTFLGV